MSIDFDHRVKKTWGRIKREEIQDDFAILYYHNDRVIGILHTGKGGIEAACNKIFDPENEIDRICFVLLKAYSFPDERVDGIYPFDMIILFVPESVDLYEYSHFGARFHIEAILDNINFYEFFFYEARKKSHFSSKYILKLIKSKLEDLQKKKKKGGSLNKQLYALTRCRIMFESNLIKEGGGTFSYNTKKRYHVLTADKEMKYFDRKGGKLKGTYSVVETTVGRGLPPNPKKKKKSLGAVLHQIKGNKPPGHVIALPKRKKKRILKNMSLQDRRRTVLAEHEYMTKERERVLSCSFFVETKKRSFLLNSDSPNVTNSWLEVLQVCGCKRKDFYVGDDDIQIDINQNNEVVIFEEEVNNEGGEMIELVRSIKASERDSRARASTFHSLLTFSSALMRVKLERRRRRRREREIRKFLRWCGDEVVSDDEREEGDSPRKKEVIEIDPNIEQKFVILKALKEFLRRGRVGLEDFIIMDTRSRDKLVTLFNDFYPNTEKPKLSEPNMESEINNYNTDGSSETKGFEDLVALVVENYQKEEIIVPGENIEEEEEGEGEEEEDTRKKKKRRKRGWCVDSILTIYNAGIEEREALERIFFYAKSILNSAVFMDACYLNEPKVIEILLDSKIANIDVNYKLSKEDVQRYEESLTGVRDTGLHRLGRAVKGRPEEEEEEGPGEGPGEGKPTSEPEENNKVVSISRKEALMVLLSHGAEVGSVNESGETFAKLVNSDPESMNIIESFLMMDDF